MDDMIPKSRIVKVECEVVIPCDATFDQVAEWLAYSFGANGSCKGDNPLLDHSPDSFDLEVEDTGLHVHKRVFDVTETDGGGRSYRVRTERRREPYTGPSEREQLAMHRP